MGQPLNASNSFIVSVCYFRSPKEVSVKYFIMLSASRSLSVLVVVLLLGIVFCVALVVEVAVVAKMACEYEVFRVGGAAVEFCCFC